MISVLRSPGDECVLSVLEAEDLKCPLTLGVELSQHTGQTYSADKEHLICTVLCPQLFLNLYLANSRERKGKRKTTSVRGPTMSQTLFMGILNNHNSLATYVS